MKREQLIKQEAAKERSIAQERAFLRGADFADNHCWISVEDDLPPTDQPYLDYQDKIVDSLKISLPVIVCTDKDTLHIATLNQNYDEDGQEDGRPFWFDEHRVGDGDWIDTHVTHWMPKLLLPEKGESK